MSAHQAPKILVIEDETTQRILAKEYLEESGFVVRLADDGKRGLEMAAAINPDLIILDLLLPSMDGYTLCTRLKQDPVTACIPVILVTAAREPDVIERGMTAGASDFVTKPVDWNYLADRVTHVLQQTRNMKRLTEENQAREQQLATLLESKEISSEQIEEIKRLAIGATPINGLSREEVDRELAAARTEADARVHLAEAALNAERAARAADAQLAANHLVEATRSFWSVLSHASQVHIPMLTALDHLTSGKEQGDATATGEFAVHAAPQTAVQSLLATTQNMVLLSQYMSGEAPLAETRVELVGLVAEAMNRLQPEAERLQVALRVTLPETEVSVNADPVRLRFALLSIVTNALKYCPLKSTVDVTLSATHGQPISLTISDDGVGMAPRQVQSLRQVASFPAEACQKQDGSLGFGIPMSIAIMAAHDGHLTLESNVGQGTLVGLHLPNARRCDTDVESCDDAVGDVASPDADEQNVPIARLNALLAS